MSIIPALLGAVNAGSLRIVDLTNKLQASTPTLNLPEPFANLIDFSLDTVSEYNEPGPFWKHANIHTGEHVGTHIDAPIHWVTGRDGHDVSEIPPARLIGPAAVLDFTAESAADSDFLIERHHIEAQEAEQGAFEPGTWLLFRTGWDARSQDQDLFLNADETGSHTPGMSAECAEWLASRDEISGIGVETVGIDWGRAGELDPPFPVHAYLLGADKYGVTSLQNLALLPPRGAAVVIAPLPIVGGTGSPARVYALVEA